MYGCPRQIREDQQSSSVFKNNFNCHLKYKLAIDQERGSIFAEGHDREAYDNFNLSTMGCCNNIHLKYLPVIDNLKLVAQAIWPIIDFDLT